MPFGVNSEVGRLRQVMVHRPGLEHARLTPSNAAELLFDDVLWVARAKAEHDMFCEAMRGRGVEVFEAADLLAQALASPEARDWVCGHILNEREVGITAARRAAEWVGSADPAVVAEFLIGEITKTDVAGTRGWCGSPPTRRRCCCRRCRTSCSSATRRAGSTTGHDQPDDQAGPQARAGQRGPTHAPVHYPVAVRAGAESHVSSLTGAGSTIAPVSSMTTAPTRARAALDDR